VECLSWVCRTRKLLAGLETITLPIPSPFRAFRAFRAGPDCSPDPRLCPHPCPRLRLRPQLQREIFTLPALPGHVRGSGFSNWFPPSQPQADVAKTPFVHWFSRDSALDPRTQRWAARPARRMIGLCAGRAWWPAVGPRLDRGVRRHFVAGEALGGAAESTIWKARAAENPFFRSASYKFFLNVAIRSAVSGFAACSN
jgi:hypothetical protein